MFNIDRDVHQVIPINRMNEIGETPKGKFLSAYSKHDEG